MTATESVSASVLHVRRRQLQTNKQVKHEHLYAYVQYEAAQKTQANASQPTEVIAVGKGAPGTSGHAVQ